MSWELLLPIALLILILITCTGCNREGFLAPIDGSYTVSERDGVRIESVEENHQLMETQGFLPSGGALDVNYPVEKNSDNLFPFADNKCSPECCANSEYSCNNGCVCMTKNQKEVLMTRGGNRTRVGNNF